MINVSDFDVLIACEESGTVRDAFRRIGINAISCDLKPTSWPGPHYKGDARDIINLRHWKAMIAHPVCKYLTNAGSKHLYRRINGVWSKENGIEPIRWDLMRKGADFFLMFEKADHIKFRAVENPIMHKHAVGLIGRRADQYVQPWWFGDPYSKATGLHLTGLPRLIRQFNKSDYDKIYQDVWMMGPSKDREEKRSKTYPGIAEAFAAQWGEIILNDA